MRQATSLRKCESRREAPPVSFAPSQARLRADPRRFSSFLVAIYLMQQVHETNHYMARATALERPEKFGSLAERVPGV
jgi:hypothetical protein